MDRNTNREYRCVSCGAPLEAGDRFCSVCGADQTAAQKTQRRESSWRCARCGALNAEEMAFCTQCGKKRAKPRRSRRWIAWLAVLLAAAGLAAFFVLYAYPNLIRPAIASFQDKRQNAAPAASTQTAAPSAGTPASTQSAGSDSGQGKTLLIFANGGSVLLPAGFREVEQKGEPLSTSVRDAGREYSYSFQRELDDGSSALIDIYEAPLHAALSEEDLAAADSPISAVYRVFCLGGSDALEDRVVVRDDNEFSCTGKLDGDEMNIRCILAGDTVYLLSAQYPVGSRSTMAPLCEQFLSSFSAAQSDDGASEYITIVPETEPAAAPETEPAAAPVGPFGPGVLRFAYGASVPIFDGFTDTTGASYVNTEMSGGYQYHFYNELVDMRVDLYEALLKNVLSYGIAVPVAEFTADGFLDARYGELLNHADVVWSARGEGYCSVMYLSDTMSVLERYIVDRDVVYVLQFRYPQAQAQACYPLADTMIANFIPAGHPDYLTPVLAGTQGASTQESAARRFVDIAVHSEWAYALRDDGTIATTSNEPALQQAVGAWRSVTQIVPGEYAVFGLHADGTVSHCLNVPVGNPEDPYKSVDGWTDIVALSAAHHVLGLKKDGTVVAAGSAYFGSAENYDFSDWTNVTELYDISGMEEGAAALRSDGYMLSLNMPFSWNGEAKNLTALSCAPYLWLGLKNDGTVICRGVDAGLVADEIKGWNGVTQVCAGSGTAAALRADGTVLTAGQFGKNDVGSWKNITAIYLDQNRNLFGVDADGNMHCCCQGTVNPIDEAAVGSWKNIVKLCFGWGGSVLGLRADGTLVASGCKLPA